MYGLNLKALSKRATCRMHIAHGLEMPHQRYSAEGMTLEFDLQLQHWQIHRVERFLLQQSV